jgi:nitrate reductase beta subunit
MVMNLDKCIGCHTCSVTCKQAWTNRAGTEYVWFNNVETRPGQGYPAHLRGPGEVARRLGPHQRPPGSCAPAAVFKKLLSIFASPVQPEHDDYYEPWTYDYETCSRPRSATTSRSRGPNRSSPASQWRHLVGQLGRRPRRRARSTPPRPDLKKLARRPTSRSSSSSRRRSCSSCRGSASTASTPHAWPRAPRARSTSAVRGWHRPGRPGQVPRLAECITGCPYKKIYFNHRPARPRSAPSATRGSRSAYPRCAPRPAWGGCATSASSCMTPMPGPRGGQRRRTTRTCTRLSCDLLLDPFDPEVHRTRRSRPAFPSDWLDAARNSPVRADQALQVALPLHPEYRTMPMVWYIPPLSPVVDLLKERATTPRRAAICSGDRHIAHPRGIPGQTVHRG